MSIVLFALMLCSKIPFHHVHKLIITRALSRVDPEAADREAAP